MYHDCLQNFILLFMSLLTAPVARNSHIVAWKSWTKFENPSISNLDISKKIREKLIK